jgi:hypothetical protein
MSAVIVGAPDLDRTDYRKKGLRAHFLKTRRVTARTGHFQVVGIRQFELQQLRQGTGAGVMHRGTDHRLDALQIELASCLAVAENNAKQLIYFAGDFLLDRFGRFFSWADGIVSATGRNSQIRVLTSTNC